MLIPWYPELANVLLKWHSFLVPLCNILLSHLEIKLLFCVVSSNLNLYIVLFDIVSDFSCEVV